jgi:hypothetical protein
VERTEPDEFRVLEAGDEIVSLLRLDRQAQWWLGRALPSAQVLQLATPSTAGPGTAGGCWPACWTSCTPTGCRWPP